MEGAPGWPWAGPDGGAVGERPGGGAAPGAPGAVVEPGAVAEPGVVAVFGAADPGDGGVPTGPAPPPGGAATVLPGGFPAAGVGADVPTGASGAVAGALPGAEFVVVPPGGGGVPVVFPLGPLSVPKPPPEGPIPPGNAMPPGPPGPPGPPPPPPGPPLAWTRRKPAPAKVSAMRRGTGCAASCPFSVAATGPVAPANGSGVKKYSRTSASSRVSSCARSRRERSEVSQPCPLGWGAFACSVRCSRFALRPSALRPDSTRAMSPISHWRCGCGGRSTVSASVTTCATTSPPSSRPMICHASGGPDQRRAVPWEFMG